jgi:uncharacterized protein
MKPHARIDIADVLRGIAVLGIVMLHSIEHFNFYRFPEPSSCGLLAFSDKAVWDGLFFAFSGKAYAIFALLFGLTFFIQDNNHTLRGGDFRLRFVWRMVLLFVWGNLNAAFFPGEVLVLFALTGLVLPLVARLPDKAVMWIAGVMLLQPDFLYNIVATLGGWSAPGAEPAFVPYWQADMDALGTGNFFTALKTNLWDGQIYSLLWARDYGRMMQAPALMMVGMLIGRRGLFAGTEQNIRFWKRAAAIALVCFFPLKGLADLVPEYISNEGVEFYVGQLLGAWHKLAFMVFMVGSIVLLFYRTKLRDALMKIAPYGRMSLTMYISQSLLASFLFFPWGLDLGGKLGSTASLGVGLAIFALQYAFAVVWLRRHKQGPLEYLWKKATWI